MDSLMLSSYSELKRDKRASCESKLKAMKKSLDMSQVPDCEESKSFSSI